MVGPSLTKLWCEAVLTLLKRYNYNKYVNCVVTKAFAYKNINYERVT